MSTGTTGTSVERAALRTTRGWREGIPRWEGVDDGAEPGPILDDRATPPPLDTALTEDTQARLPLIFGGISVALARTFKVVDAELKAVHTQEWERAFSLFRLLI